jgi:hypothetical protein
MATRPAILSSCTRTKLAPRGSPLTRVSPSSPNSPSSRKALRWKTWVDWGAAVCYDIWLKPRLTLRQEAVTRSSHRPRLDFSAAKAHHSPIAPRPPSCRPSSNQNKVKLKQQPNKHPVWPQVSSAFLNRWVFSCKVLLANMQAFTAKRGIKTAWYR